MFDVEKGVANKWRWEWMLKMVEIADPSKQYPKLKWTHGSVKMVAKDHIRKIDEAGKAVCVLCKGGHISYADGGVQSITNHLKRPKHLKNGGDLYNNQMIPGASVPVNEMYGAPSLFYGDVAVQPSASTNSAPSRPAVHVLDRTANFEAMIVGFIAEHSLSLSISEGLVELAQELAKDESALKRVKLHRTTSSYKLVHGLGLTWRTELLEKLRITPFSLNMDESSSTNSKHVFTILVSFYNASTKSIAVEHLGSVDVPSCTSDNLFVETKKLFQVYNLPWKILLAILSDSASTMRGKISGLETLIRNSVAPHMLDIDGESCHHMHNIVKKFTSFFDFFLENLFRDVANEFKFCVDSLAMLQEFAFHMNTTFRKPHNFHQCRWLSVYDSSVEFDAMVDVHKVFFSICDKADAAEKLKRCTKELKKVKDGVVAVTQKKVGVDVTQKKENAEPKPKSKKELQREEKTLKERVEKSQQKKEKALIRSKVTQASQEAMRDLENHVMEKFKTGTEKGKERKRRVVSTILYKPNRYTLLVSFYKTVLPIFKQYVLLFQSDLPLIHKVYPKQISLVMEFYSYFVKPDVLENHKKGKDLLTLDLKKENLLPRDLIFIGLEAKKLVKKLGMEHVDVVDFLDRVEKAYVQCGQYIQTKLPLENKVLKALTSIDPLMVCSPNAIVLRRLLSLPSIFSTVLAEEEEELFEKEARAVCVDGHLPPALDVKMKEVDCLDWWASISDRYPCIYKIVCAALSIFHGPRVESTFNVMGDVIDKKSGRMNMETYGAYQDIKYGLKSRQPSSNQRAVKLFSRKERLFTPIDPKLSNNMRNASRTYNRINRQKRKEKEERIEQFEMENPTVTTAKKLKLDAVAYADKGRKDHQRVLAEAYSLKRLIDVPGEKSEELGIGKGAIRTITETAAEAIEAESAEIVLVEAESVEVQPIAADTIEAEPVGVVAESSGGNGLQGKDSKVKKTMSQGRLNKYFKKI